ncbi:MAG: Hsp70 family protein [Selenomonadaceae bacterium]|nr:Hsp70 family protein [Selenomonadaceae bacterium]
MNEIFVGIDLGTTNTLACYLKRGRPNFIRFAGSGEMLPSVLYVDEEKNIFVGEKAKKRGVIDPLNVIRSSKTYMADFEKTWNVHGKNFTPTKVASEILQEVKRQIMKKLHCADDDTINAVITVPAYFTANQKDETKKAGIAAGFNVLQIITEPMAAAVAVVHELGLDEKIFVVDLGGGTFDISVLQADQKNRTYRALDIDGDRKLGGDDFDALIYDYFIGIIQSETGLDLSTQKKSTLEYNEYYSMTGRVREAAEDAKIALSEQETYTADLMNLFQHDGKNYDFTVDLTREKFNEICQPLYEKITSRINKFIEGSDKFKLDEIGTVILAGGSCHIPKVKSDVENIFGKRTDTQLDLGTLVAVGACFVAETFSGVKTDIEQPQEKFEDIISHSLGVEVLASDGVSKVLSKIIRKGDVYPCQKTKLYTTTMDEQTTIPIYIYEAGSDCENIADIDAHEFYGDLSLEIEETAPAGVPVINVTFSYDKSGTLEVTARDEKSGVNKSIKIKKGSRDSDNF